MSAVSPIGGEAPQDAVEQTLSRRREGKQSTTADAAILQSDSQFYEKQNKQPNDDFNKVNPRQFKLYFHARCVANDLALGEKVELAATRQRAAIAGIELPIL